MGEQENATNSVGDRYIYSVFKAFVQEAKAGLLSSSVKILNF